MSPGVITLKLVSNLHKKHYVTNIDLIPSPLMQAGWREQGCRTDIEGGPLSRTWRPSPMKKHGSVTSWIPIKSPQRLQLSECPHTHTHAPSLRKVNFRLLDSSRHPALQTHRLDVAPWASSGFLNQTRLFAGTRGRTPRIPGLGQLAHRAPLLSLCNTKADERREHSWRQDLPDRAPASLSKSRGDMDELKLEKQEGAARNMVKPRDSFVLLCSQALQVDLQVR